MEITTKDIDVEELELLVEKLILQNLLIKIEDDWNPGNGKFDKELKIYYNNTLISSTTL